MRTPVIRVWAVGMLALSLGAGGGSALAHGKLSHHAPLKGVITAISASSLQLQTQSGAVTVAITDGVQVTRLLTGSMADVAAGVYVDLRIAKGTTTVNAVRVSLVPRPVQGHRPAGPHRTTTKAPGHAHAAHPAKPSSGQVMAVTPTSITVKDNEGQTATYTLAANVTVTKLVSGHVTDLQVGQAVEVGLGRAGSARTIEILNS